MMTCSYIFMIEHWNPINRHLMFWQFNVLWIVFWFRLFVAICKMRFAYAILACFRKSVRLWKKPGCFRRSTARKYSRACANLASLPSVVLWMPLESRQSHQISLPIQISPLSTRSQLTRRIWVLMWYSRTAWSKTQKPTFQPILTTRTYTSPSTLDMPAPWSSCLERNQESLSTRKG